LDDNYYDLIVNNATISSYDSDNITLLNSLYSLRHVLKYEKEACGLEQNPYETLPALFTITSTPSMDNSDLQPSLDYSDTTLSGRGIIVGIIDTGIDYRHPAFINNDKSTRILSIWDQTIQEGPPPADFTFGSEYNKSLINNALMSKDPLSVVPSTDENGHGTAIASIIAGSVNSDHSLSGIVPESELVVVKLKEAKQNLKNIFFAPPDSLCFQESDIMLGVRYLTTVSQRLNRPLVICIALGSSHGGHDGYGPLSTSLDIIIRYPGIGICVAAGDEGGNNRHYFNNTVSEPYSNEFALNIGNSDRRFSMEIWPYAPQRFSIEVTPPNLKTTQIVYPSLNQCQGFILGYNQSFIWVNNIAFESSTGDPVILIRFENPIPGIWNLRVRNNENEPFSFHSWLPSGNLISDETYFLKGDPNTTITTPGNTMSILTVTAYNQINDTILPESGRGYTRSGLIKPDVAAPGFQLPCAIPELQYGTLTGTGAAAAQAAGIIAMIMEWAYSRGNFTAITGVQINRMIIREAYRSNMYIYPNNIWGYGQINISNILNLLSGLKYS
jgi:subtilisin family serine protease